MVHINGAVRVLTLCLPPDLWGVSEKADLHHHSKAQMAKRQRNQNAADYQARQECLMGEWLDEKGLCPKGAQWTALCDRQFGEAKR